MNTIQTFQVKKIQTVELVAYFKTNVATTKKKKREKKCRQGNQVHTDMTTNALLSKYGGIQYEHASEGYLSCSLSC